MPWNAPVNVELRGNYLTIQDSPAAAELLLESPPENALGEEYQQALQACVADWKDYQIRHESHSSKQFWPRDYQSVQIGFIRITRRHRIFRKSWIQFAEFRNG